MHASGMAVVKHNFVAPPGAQSPMVFERVFTELVMQSRPSLVSAPPYRAPLQSHLADPAYKDDAGISSDEEDQDDDVAEEGEEEDKDLVPHLLTLPFPISLTRSDPRELRTRDSTSHSCTLQPPASSSSSFPYTPTSSLRNGNLKLCTHYLLFRPLHLPQLRLLCPALRPHRKEDSSSAGAISSLHYPTTRILLS
ncbi:hypothetical protein F4604DRAFT_2042821 [Suillus subluteus]|nr:hypothetical protein F4604DRAFT_2042821 [Suillus subluteus]